MAHFVAIFYFAERQGFEEGWVGGEATAAPPWRKVLETVGFQGASRNLLEASDVRLPSLSAVTFRGIMIYITLKGRLLINLIIKK